MRACLEQLINALVFQFYRYRQAPPEHHHRDSAYNSLGSSSTSLYTRSEPRRSAVSSSASLLGSRSGGHSGSNTASGSRTGSSYGKSLAAIRKATQVTAASVTSRIRKRAAAIRPTRDRERDVKRYLFTWL